MKKLLSGDPPLLNAEETHMEMVRRAAECKYNDGVICGLWEKNQGRCKRCNWNPNKGTPAEE